MNERYGVFTWASGGRYPERDAEATYKRKHAAQVRADQMNSEGGNFVVRSIIKR